MMEKLGCFDTGEASTDYARERVSRAAFADHVREQKEAHAAWATLVRLGWIKEDAVAPWEHSA